MENNKKQVALIVLDGWGYREEVLNNAVASASTPVFDKIWNEYPHTLLEASGLAVGLPEGQMGNSEIGHTTIGAGKVIDTDLVRIKKAIDRGEFDTNPVFQNLFEHVKKYDSTLHVSGLLGKGGVHAHSDHLFAFLRSAKKAGVKKIDVHAFTDGRDTSPQSAREYLKDLEAVLEELGVGFIASVTGRFYAMDRDNNWDRVQRAEEALMNAKGKYQETRKPSEVMHELYEAGIVDEHLEPIVFLDNGEPHSLGKNDGVFFFNFRADRARQLSRRIEAKCEENGLCFVTLTEYDPEIRADVAFKPVSIESTLAGEISKAGLSQAHIAETEKFPHATYFLNGGREKPHDNEVHLMLESRKDVPTHDLAPKMRAEGIADEAIKQIENGANFIFINFANPDMVGHTANVPAIIEALEEVDAQLGRVLNALHKKGGQAFVTADHGNAEVNIDEETNDRHTSHTTNPVPAIITNSTSLLNEGSLADIAPTILEMFGLNKPESMTGRSLMNNQDTDKQ
jgi:2,3-bisphosphoglycerate-independent phosphoglycerate mutase